MTIHQPVTHPDKSRSGAVSDRPQQKILRITGFEGEIGAVADSVWFAKMIYYIHEVEWEDIVSLLARYYSDNPCGRNATLPWRRRADD